MVKQHGYLIREGITRGQGLLRGEKKAHQYRMYSRSADSAATCILVRAPFWELSQPPCRLLLCARMQGSR